MKRIVVAGGGLAGLRAAEGLREHGFDGPLTLISEERRRPYQRPPLSKDLLAGRTEADACGLRCDHIDVEWMLGRRAARLDAERGLVVLADGDVLPYDGLVIATGRRSRPWPEDLPELEGFHLLRTLDDALALREAAAAQPRVAIVGAGFIGCEVAATLRAQGLEVTVIEMGGLPLPALGSAIGGRALRLHTEHGVTLRMSARVEGFDGRGRVEAVRLQGGERIEADLVLLALGSIPNSEWLGGSAIERHRGSVLTDQHCQVPGHDGIAAAGDVAAWPHPHADGPVCVEHWTNAGDMGLLAAANLLRSVSERERFVPVPTFWSDQYEVTIKSAGLFGHADAYEVVAEERGEKWRLIVEGRRGGELVGAVTFNRNRSFIDYRRRLAQPLATRASAADITQQ